MWSRSLADFEMRLEREKGSLGDTVAGSAAELKRKAEENLAAISQIKQR
jgi:hypothetical protein